MNFNSQPPSDYFTKDPLGNLTVSENNKESDVAFYFYHEAFIRSEVKSYVEASLLTNQLQEMFMNKLEEELKKIREESSSPAKSQRGSYDIKGSLATSLINGFSKESLPQEHEAEWVACAKTVYTILSEMTEGDKIWDYFVEKNRAKKL